MKFGIGQPLVRVEDARLLTGNGLYTDDISFENQAYMYVVRSPHANAKILDVNVTEALNINGLICFTRTFYIRLKKKIKFGKNKS